MLCYSVAADAVVLGLDDGVLITANHLAIAGGVGEAVKSAKEKLGHLHKIKVQVASESDLREAISNGADILLLEGLPTEEVERLGTMARDLSPVVSIECSGENYSAKRACLRRGWGKHDQHWCTYELRPGNEGEFSDPAILIFWSHRQFEQALNQARSTKPAETARKNASIRATSCYFVDRFTGWLLSPETCCGTERAVLDV